MFEDLVVYSTDGRIRDLDSIQEGTEKIMNDAVKVTYKSIKTWIITTNVSFIVQGKTYLTQIIEKEKRNGKTEEKDLERMRSNGGVLYRENEIVKVFYDPKNPENASAVRLNPQFINKMLGLDEEKDLRKWRTNIRSFNIKSLKRNYVIASALDEWEKRQGELEISKNYLTEKQFKTSKKGVESQVQMLTKRLNNAKCVYCKKKNVQVAKDSYGYKVIRCEECGMTETNSIGLEEHHIPSIMDDTL